MNEPTLSSVPASISDALATLKKAAVYIAAVFLIGALLGWLLYAKCNPPPEIKPGLPDTTFHVKPPVKDTSHPDPVIKIKYYPVHDTTRDTTYLTAAGPAPAPIDSAPCWNFYDTAWSYKDTTKRDSIRRASVSLEICSKALPAKKPIDYTSFMVLDVAPDTDRTILRIDTVTRHTPFFKDKKNWIIAGLLAVLEEMIRRDLKEKKK